MKKHFILLTAMLVILTSPVFADAATAKALEKNIANTQTMFEQQKTIPAFLFTDLKNEGNSSMTIRGGFYSLTFYSKTVREFDKSIQRFEFQIERQLDKMEEYNAAIGEKTPKYVLNFKGSGELPASTTITLHDTSFAPYSTVNVYRVLGNQRYEVIQKGIEVNKDAAFSFTVEQRGTYFITSRAISDRVNTFFERDIPERTPVDELLDDMREGSRYDFSDLITRVQIGD